MTKTEMERKMVVQLLNSSGDEQHGDQLEIGARGARVGMSLISKKEVSGTEHKIE